jgi:hypothetical protein
MEKSEENLCICKKGIKRSHTCEDYVIWMCESTNCTNQELEHFSDLDDEGWIWLRESYKK